MGNQVAPGIITFGLGGNHSNVILGMPFNLGFVTVAVGSPILPPGSPSGSPITPPIPPPQGGGGGGIPMAPGEIGKLYKPVDDPWHTLQDFPDGTRFPVKIKISFRGKELERNYIVTKKRTGMIIKVVKFLKKVQDTTNIVVSNFKKKAINAIKLLNIRKK